MLRSLSVSRIAVTDSLLTRVKVDSTIDTHGHLLRGLMRELCLPQLEGSSRRCLIHHITTSSRASSGLLHNERCYRISSHLNKIPATLPSKVQLQRQLNRAGGADLIERA